MRSQLINMGILTRDSTKNTNTSTNDSTNKDNKRSRDDLKSSSSRFSKQPNNTTTTTTNSTSKDNTNYPRCTGCGSFHGGNEKTCLAREHPDFNKSKVAFEDTTMGKHYRDRGKSRIDFHQRWDGLTETFIPYAFKIPRKEGSSSHVSEILAHLLTLPNKEHLYLGSKIAGLSARILLDTGAPSSFIS